MSADSPYDFLKFLDSIKDKDFPAIVQLANEEAYRVEQKSYGVRGAIHAREQGSVKYADSIKGFLFFMHTGAKPAGISSDEFQAYRIVVEKLVAKGQLKSEALEIFQQKRV